MEQQNNQVDWKTGLLSDGRMHCRFRSDVDNQVGNLCYIMTNVMKFYNVDFMAVEGYDVSGIEFNTYRGADNVLRAADVVPRELAREVRDFLTKIPFDSQRPVIDDGDNQPHDKVRKFINCQGNAEHGLQIKAAYDNRKNEPTEWTWEHYNSTFWRAMPLTAEAFCGSPIVKLISVLEQKWRNTNMSDVWGDRHTLQGLNKITWVIQRVDRGSNINWHQDDFGTRRISFIYYLTPDDWSKRDGGKLLVKDDEREIIICPTFNTMIFWDMWDKKSPLHSVETVETDKLRFCLVGFFG